ncbi:MAG: hypothetical protein D6738_09085 [Acidobacteria bacterium]|nr:MAG: hypothetical protein D6738_09085 [Acidobacteriota bacterium]
MTAWNEGDLVAHRFNPDLGPGRVVLADGRFVEVEFPEAETRLRFARGTDALVPLAEVGPLGRERSLAERLAAGAFDAPEEVTTRLEARRLEAIRQADGLGSFLGGRIRLFPHQLYAAERATRRDPVRWLFADEVGLGKTVEACLVANHLVRTGRARSVLVVAPATLTVQWLGELWRKFHSVYTLIDDKRLADVEREFGAGFNPFEAHRRAIVALETLVDRPDLARRAAEAGIDLLVVDEAHRLRRLPGRPGDPAYRVVAPLTAACRHVLLLTATPLAEDAHGFFRLLQLLRPDEIPEQVDPERWLAEGRPLPDCVSSTRRRDLEGLPPRVPRPVEIPEPAWHARHALERALLAAPADDPLQRRRKAERLERALGSGAALAGLLGRDEDEIAALARAADRDDPRLAWLCEHAPRWRERGEKTLLFVARRETLTWLREALSRRVQLRTGVFHEDLTPGQRDIEVAQFRLASGPSLLVSTEAGGEGRNFEFCTRIVLFDLPWDPMVVEQRIGRLDRIGRTRDVEIVYFRDPRGVDRLVCESLERIRLFEEPLGGLEPELLEIGAALRDAALALDAETLELPAGAPAIDPLRRAQQATETARGRLRSSAWDALHREPYTQGMAEAILARVPAELEELTEEVITSIAEIARLEVEQLGGRARWAIALGTQALFDSLPGVPAGASFLGSFDREEAVAAENEDFFASGHPLVEGLLGWYEDAPLGRVGALHLVDPEHEGFGIAAFYADGLETETITVDLRGRRRPEWERLLARRPLRSRRVRPETWARQPGFREAIARMATALPHDRTPLLLVAVRVSA